jgi:nucleotide-binding universal stress UspA family protein
LFVKKGYLSGIIAYCLVAGAEVVAYFPILYHTFMKSILVPTDFSPAAHHAYTVALQLAQHTGGSVMLLYVLEAPEGTTANFSTYGGPVNGSELPNSTGGIDRLFTLKLMEATKHRMHVLKDEAATLAAEVPVQDTVELGGIGEGILAAIEKHHIDLVVMGVENRGGLDDYFLGSQTERLIRLAPCPVLAVKPSQTDFNVRTILFPSDFSAEANGAIAGLQSVLTAFPEATLHLLHVTSGSTDEEGARQDMQAFATQHGLAHYQAAVVAADSTSAGIEQYAQRVRADLVVLPTHQHSGLSSFLHTSVADAVAIHALPPVLTYHFAA